jgi:hypothetical protein
LRYGTNDRYKVPSYRRSGAGRIIGSPGFLTIHRDGANERFSINDNREGSGGAGSAFRDKALVAATARLKPKRIKPSSPAPTSTASSQEDFIPLCFSSSRKRKRLSSASPSPSDSSAESDSTSQSPSPDGLEQEEISTAKQRSISLSRAVKANPSDTASWLELIGLQDSLFPTPPTSSSRTADESKAVAQLRLALYEEALPHAVGTADRERLLVGLMREGAKVWDFRVLERKWDEVVKSEGRSFWLWKEWLAFKMTGVSGARLSVDEGRALIQLKLKQMEEELRDMAQNVVAVEGGNGEWEGIELLCNRVVYLFLRLTRFLQDTGFAELAVAAWQAVLEMTFSRPADYGSTDSAPEAFADFWESEVARIGEDGAKGWQHFAVGRMDDPPEAKRDSLGDMPPTAEPFKAWAAIERQRAENARMPARTLDHGTEDDPFRVVLFSDIKDILVWFPSIILSLVKPKLVDAFLVFCGLPTASLSGEGFADLLGDPFVTPREEALDLDLNRPETEVLSDLSRRAPQFEQQGGNMAISQEILFGTGWFRYLGHLSSATSRVDSAWVIGTLKYLVHSCRVEELAEYYLAMAWLNEPAGARKIAKALLREHSSNIKLYNAYALVEWANQNVEVSNKVLSSATGLVPVSRLP